MTALVACPTPKQTRKHSKDTSPYSANNIARLIEQRDWRLFTAYHEAGHTIVGYSFGWWLREEGVEIDERQYCAMRCYTEDHTEQAVLCMKLAGWGAEMRLAPTIAPPRSDDELRYHLEELRWDRDEPEGDDITAFAHLMKERPSASDEEMIAAYRFYEAATTALLSHADVWVKVERVAHALLRDSRLSHAEVLNLIK